MIAQDVEIIWQCTSTLLPFSPMYVTRRGKKKKDAQTNSFFYIVVVNCPKSYCWSVCNSFFQASWRVFDFWVDIWYWKCFWLDEPADGDFVIKHHTCCYDESRNWAARSWYSIVELNIGHRIWICVYSI